jgi:hypothetical protein
MRNCDVVLTRALRSGNDPDMEDFVPEDEEKEGVEAAELLKVTHAMPAELLATLRND